MLLISNNMHASADTNMTLTQDFCVRDCQHNYHPQPQPCCSATIVPPTPIMPLLL
jgi:hypothetical protein